MAKPLFATNLELKPKAHIRIAVDILHDATRFTCDLGFEDPDIALHFNPRFNYYDYNTKVCDTRVNGYFGRALKERHFPFRNGTRAEVSIIFEESFFRITLPDGYQFTYPNYTRAKIINYLKAHGDMIFRTLAFE